MKYLRAYFNYLKTIQLSKKTISNYMYLFKSIEFYFNSKNLTDERTVTEKDIIEYVLYLKESKIMSYYLNILYLKKYFQFLESERIIFINPTENIDLPKFHSISIKPIPKEELSIILSKIKTNNDYGIRSKAIFETLYSTAMRPFELSNLKIVNVDFKKKEVFIERGKFSKDRVVPIGDTALKWVEKYLTKVRPKYIKDKSNIYLFISVNGSGSKLTTRSIHGLIQNTLKINKLQRIKPYSLRKSCAKHCLVNGMNIFYIQKLLGHNSIATTMKYLQLDTMDLKSILKSSHPRNKY